MTRAIKPSPARAEPHDATAWFPVPDASALPSIQALLDAAIATSHDPVLDAALDTMPLDEIDLVALEALVSLTPARAEPHDAAAWLPLPGDLDSLPELGDMLEPSAQVRAAVVAEAEAVISDASAAAEAAVAPSPARAEPHDSASWLPLPDPASLEPLAGLSPPNVSRPSRRHRVGATARRPRTWILLTLVVVTVVAGMRLTAEPTPVAVAGVAPIRVSVDLDGAVTTISTTARSAAGLAKQLDVGKLVAVRHAPTRLAPGSTVVLRTRKSGQLDVDGQVLPYDSPSLTVAELLSAYGIALDGDDTSSPTPDSVLADGTAVQVIRVGAATRQTQEAIPFAEEVVDDPTIPIGEEREIRAGVPGVATVTWRARIENGVEVGQVPLSKVPTTEPVSRVVGRGTSADWHWDALANCESGGRWGTVDGGSPSYDGGLGILRENWVHYGGLQFAPNAGLATREEQIVIAQRIYDQYGWDPWGCARTLHWPI
ncbi:MAG: transglycosylase family protein [Acidimicrobiia bacterium]